MQLNVPAELAELKQWIIWERVVRRGKTSKIPLRPRDGHRASTTRVQDWGTLDDAILGCKIHGADGIGFVFSKDDDYCGVDLDDCFVEGDLHPAAAAIIESINSYTELSPSREGVHVIYSSSESRAGSRSTGQWGGSLEVYGQGRYFTFTGVTLEGYELIRRSSWSPPLPHESEQRSPGQISRQALDKALQRDATLRRLFYDGFSPDDWSSPSDADMTFVSRLVRAVGPNPIVIRGILKESALWRPKWDTSDYFARTLSRAMDLTPEDQLELKQYQLLRAREAARERIRREDATEERFELPAVGWSLTDELELPEVAEEYRVDLLFPTDSNLLLIAPFKAGKSTMMRNLVRSLVDGVPFLGHYEVRQVEGKVCYLNYEETSQAWLRSMRSLPIGHSTHIAPVHRRGLGPIPFWDDIRLEEFSGWLRANEAEVLIVDTAVAAWRGYVDNENDNMQVSNFARLLDDLKSASGVRELVLVHHSGREAGRGRGASSLEGWMDVGVYIDVDNKGARSVRAVGRNVHIESREIVLNRDSGELLIGSVAKSRKAKAERMRSLRSELLDLLKRHPEGLPRSTIAAELKAARKTVFELLDDLIASPGSSVSEKHGPNNSKLIYSDPNSGKPGR